MQLADFGGEAAQVIATEQHFSLGSRSVRGSGVDSNNRIGFSLQFPTNTTEEINNYNEIGAATSRPHLLLVQQGESAH